MLDTPYGGITHTFTVHVNKVDTYFGVPLNELFYLFP